MGPRRAPGPSRGQSRRLRRPRDDPAVVAAGPSKSSSWPPPPPPAGRGGPAAKEGLGRDSFFFFFYLHTRLIHIIIVYVILLRIARYGAGRYSVSAEELLRGKMYLKLHRYSNNDSVLKSRTKIVLPAFVCWYVRQYYFLFFFFQSNIRVLSNTEQRITNPGTLSGNNT